MTNVALSVTNYNSDPLSVLSMPNANFWIKKKQIWTRLLLSATLCFSLKNKSGENTVKKTIISKLLVASN